LYILLSALTGLTCAVLTFFILIASFFALGLFGWSDGGDKKYLDRLKLTTNISMSLSMLVALGAGIFIAYRMIKRPNQEKDSPDKITDS